jgi:hypothetical protein
MSGDGASLGDATATRPRLRPAVPAVIVVAFVGVLWWWWPNTRSGTSDSDLRSGRADVVVIADGQVAQAADEVARRVRESGRSIIDVGGASSWCDVDRRLRSIVEEHRPGVVVVSIRAEGQDCDEFAKPETDGWVRLVEEAAPARLVVVVQPGPPGIGQSGVVRASLRRLEATTSAILADPSRLLGEDGAERLPCQWWDDCEPDGLVTVRTPDGLTIAGGERIARTIAAVLP